ncbi:hypothetical protein PMAYCL1PPCAC_09990, partial [Pristionchus mayeri]
LKKNGMRYIHPFTSCSAFTKAFFGFFPILRWLPNYSLKNYFIADLLGGITVGVMNVPQGIAYAALAGLPAVTGLYTSFLPPLIYMLFGTSRTNSISAFSVVCLMTGLAVERFTDPTNAKYAETVGFIKDPAMLPTPEQVASSLTMLIALMNLLMATLRLEFFTTYLSDTVVSSFTAAASVHVLVSQLPDALGIKDMVKHDGQNGYLVMNLYEIIIRIPHVNLYACGIALVSMIYLMLGKEVLSVQLLKRCNFPWPIPYELLLIVIATICSYFFDLNDPPFNVKVIGNITTGLPTPSVPRFDLMPALMEDAFTITIVVYAMHMSLGKMFAKKHDYEIDANQELIAIGFMSFAAGFFPIYPTSCSLSRTLMNVRIGTKTLLSNIFAASLVLATILFLATYLEPLPKPVLSAIVIVAIYSIVNNFKMPVMLWSVSTIDCSIWAVSFVATVFIDIVPGLTISILYALFTTIAREQWPRWHMLGKINGDLDFEEMDRYENVSFFQAICMFRFDAPLLFTNADRFKKSAAKAIQQWETEHWDLKVEMTEKLPIVIEGDVEKKEKVEILSRHFIIDCSGFTFVDYMGVMAMKEVFLEMHARGVLVYFAAAKAPVRDLFAKCGFHEQVPKEHFYPTTRDAVAIARLRLRTSDGHYDHCAFEQDNDGFSEITTASL